MELSEAIASDGEKLKQAARVMTNQQRRQIAELLADYLCSNPTVLSQLAWVPDNLRSTVLKRLSFTIRRIGGENIEDAHLEKIAECKFVSVSYLGRKYEQWLFQTPKGENIPVFGTGDIEAIALS